MKLPCAECGTMIAFGKYAERRGEIPDAVLCPTCNKKQRVPKPEKRVEEKWGRRNADKE